MTLREAIEQYIAWRQAHGAKFHSGAALLHLFLNGIDEEIACDAVTDAQVCAFLAGIRPLTRYRANKYSALAGFYRYAISRGYASRSPLPDDEPKTRPSPPPYIYSHDEIRRLLDAIDLCRRRAVQLDAHLRDPLIFDLRIDAQLIEHTYRSQFLTMLPPVDVGV